MTVQSFVWNCCVSHHQRRKDNMRLHRCLWNRLNYLSSPSVDAKSQHEIKSIQVYHLCNTHCSWFDTYETLFRENIFNKLVHSSSNKFYIWFTDNHKVHYEKISVVLMVGCKQNSATFLITTYKKCISLFSHNTYKPVANILYVL